MTVPTVPAASPLLLDPAGGLPNGHTYQLLVEGDPGSGRLTPSDVGITVHRLPDRLERRAGMVPNGWAARLETPVSGSGRWSGRDLEAHPVALEARAEEAALPGSDRRMPVRFTEVFAMRVTAAAEGGRFSKLWGMLKRDKPIDGVPETVAQARVAVPGPEGWDAMPARKAGELSFKATVGTFTPDAEGPFLVHARMPQEGEARPVSERTLVIHAVGLPVPSAGVKPGVDLGAVAEGKVARAHIVFNVPEGMTIGFISPVGRPLANASEFTIAQPWPQPYVNITRTPEEVRLQFGHPEAAEAGLQGRIATLFGAGSPGRVGNLFLDKAGSVTSPSSATSYQLFSGNAHATMAAALHGQDVMTVRAGATGTLQQAIETARQLGYQEVLVAAGRHLPRPWDAEAGVEPFDPSGNQLTDQTTSWSMGRSTRL